MAKVEKIINYPELVGQVIATYRTNRGLSQGDLAAALGLDSLTAYETIEKGEVTLSTSELRVLSKKLGEKPETLLSEVENLAKDLESNGFKVVDGSQDSDLRKGMLGGKMAWVIGGAALAGLVGVVIAARRGGKED